MGILFLDLETTGIPKRNSATRGFYPPTEYHHYDGSRAIEIGYILVSHDNEKILEKSILIKPDGYDVTNSHIHGITMQILCDKGIHITEALDIFLSAVEQADTVVCYNNDFDINILVSECYRYGREDVAQSLLQKTQVCAMKTAMEFFGRRRYMKLIDCYKEFNPGIEYEQKHRAVDDCELTRDIYFKMMFPKCSG